jgi:hypothetical protein
MFGLGWRKQNRELKRVIVWMAGRDTGTSSTAMARFLATGERGPGGNAAYPSDGSDLGRCIRMLRFMGWEHRVPEMAGCTPVWAALAMHWDELVALHNVAEKEELPYIPRRKSKARDAAIAAREASANRRLYDRMKEILRPFEGPNYINMANAA